MSWILGNWVRLIPWVLGALVLLGAWFYAHRQQTEITGLKKDLAIASANGAMAENLARSNAAALDVAARQHASDMTAVQNHYQHQATAAKATATLMESINHAPQSDDGPVAPVLKYTLDCLRQRAAAAPGAASPDCAAYPSGSPAGLPAKP